MNPDLQHRYKYDCHHDTRKVKRAADQGNSANCSFRDCQLETCCTRGVAHVTSQLLGIGGRGQSRPMDHAGQLEKPYSNFR